MNDTLVRIRRAASVELVPDRTARRIIAVAAFAVATALAAQVRLPLPLTPVPLTLQTLFVILSGALLGPRLGAASQIAYLGMGVAGLPVFSGGGLGLAWLAGPTGGYLLAFPVTAYLSGVVSTRVRGRSFAGAAALFAGLFAASLVILAGGSAWLGVVTGDPVGALALGVAPFLVGDLLKVALATLIAWRARDRTLGLL